jgi:hypothetical protein
MGKFVGALYLRYNHETKRWVTLKEIAYHSKTFGRVTVPAGYSTDLDSVPRIPFAYAWLKGRATKSAVVHDWLYYNKHDRKKADKIFLNAMKDEGVAAWRRLPIYSAVRAFGWLAYK